MHAPLITGLHFCLRYSSLPLSSATFATARYRARCGDGANMNQDMFQHDMSIGNESGEEWISIGFAFKDAHAFDCRTRYAVNEGSMDRYTEHLCTTLPLPSWPGAIRSSGWQIDTLQPIVATARGSKPTGGLSNGLRSLLMTRTLT